MSLVKIQPPTPTSQYVGVAFSLPPEDVDNLSFYDIFSQFWSDEITELIVEQTNRYSVMKKGKSVNTNISKIEVSWNPYDDGHFPYTCIF